MATSLPVPGHCPTRSLQEYRLRQGDCFDSIAVARIQTKGRNGKISQQAVCIRPAGYWQHANIEPESEHDLCSGSTITPRNAVHFPICQHIAATLYG